MAKTGTKVAAGEGIDIRIAPRKPPRKSKFDREAERLEDDASEKISRMKSELGAGAGFTVCLWRYNDLVRDDERLLPDIPLEDWNGADGVFTLYGGGRYTAKVRNPKGEWVANGKSTFRLAGAPRSTNPAATGMADVALAEMKGRLEAMTAAKPASGDAGAMAVQIATAISTSMMTGMTMMAKMFGNQNGAPQKDPLELVAGVLDLTDRLRGNGGGDGGGGGGGMDVVALKLVDNMLTGLRELAQAQRGQPRPPAKVIASIGPGAPPADTPPAPASEKPAAAAPTVQHQEVGQGGPVNLSLLTPYIDQLVTLAQRDKDPDLYAAVLLDQLGDKLPPVVKFLEEERSDEERAQIQAAILNAFPQTATYAGWFEAFFESLWATIDGEDDAPPDSNQPPAASGAGPMPEGPTM